MTTVEMTGHYKKEYRFGQRKKTENEELIGPEQLYQCDGTPGFLTERNRNASRRLQIPELNSGFDTAYWYAGTEITEITGDEYGIRAAFKENGRGQIPLSFKCDVPEEGNYLVTVQITAEKEVDPALIFIGRRRLYLCRKMEKGEHVCESYVVNVCPVIARNQSSVLEDLSIDVTVIGEGVHLNYVRVEKAHCRTIYIAGDSTVTDQNTDYPYVPGASYSGWGQMLSAFLGNEFAVSNHSHSGLTTESFRSEGHYRVMRKRLHAGDLCLIQFGHNDQKLDKLKAEGGYRDRLIRYFREIRAKGAVPVLVTPLSRNSWKGIDGTYNDLLEEYDRVCIETGWEYKVPVVRLHELSRAFVISRGREDAKRFFYPSDYTHTNDYGAYYFAETVARELAAQRLISSVRENGKWQPPKVIAKPAAPLHLASVPNPAEERLFENLQRPEDDLTRTEALEFVIQSMHFFPTNVYNDVFDDVVGHETYAGAVECACQNDIIPKEIVSGHIFRPTEPVTGREFEEFVINGYHSRISGSPGENTFPEDFIQSKRVKRSTAAEICRRLHI